MAQDNGKMYLFEQMPIPRAVASLAIPMVVTSLVMVIYNLADTFFVGMLNDPVQNAAVTLVYPVMLAFNDVFGTDATTVATIASGFGGGMARMREVCGTVSAIGMAAGFISPAITPKNMEERTANYALVQELAGEFRKENGSIVCRELLGLDRKPAAGNGAGLPLRSRRWLGYQRIPRRCQPKQRTEKPGILGRTAVPLSP